MCDAKSLRGVLDREILRAATSIRTVKAPFTASSGGATTSAAAALPGPGDEYPPLARRHVRDAELVRLCGADNSAVRASQQLTADFAAAILSLQRPLLLARATAAAGATATGASSSPRIIRIAAISDTHHHHERVFLPSADVLVHCGDIVGNYGDDVDLLLHVTDFVTWLRTTVAPRYEHVVFIAGNHDTILDSRHLRNRDATSKRGRWHRAARALLRDPDALPANCTYLEHGGVTLPNGLRVWGSPATPSRQETLGKRYYSNAFETIEAERAPLYALIPERLDVLLTHAPSTAQAGTLCGRSGDALLARRLGAMAAPPTLHCCGHDHDHAGVANGVDANCLAINAAQEGILRLDDRSGGCAWLVDVVPRNVAEAAAAAPRSLHAMGSAEPRVAAM